MLISALILWISLSTVHCVPAPVLDPSNAVNVIVNSSVQFSCTGTGDNILFIINNRSVNDFTDEGFAQSQGQDMLDVNLIRRNLTLASATANLNNTEIYCQIDDLTEGANFSDTSIIKIQGPLNAVGTLDFTVTSIMITVTWSAPHTLDGVPILGYNITITNTSNGNILYTYFTQDTQYVISKNDGDPCTELTLTISGYNGAGDGETSSFNFTYPGETDNVRIKSLQVTSNQILVSINVTSLCPSQYPTNATVHINSTAYDASTIDASTIDIEDGLLTLTVDNLALTHSTVYTMLIVLRDGNGVITTLQDGFIIMVDSSSIISTTSIPISTTSTTTTANNVTPSSVIIANIATGTNIGAIVGGTLAGGIAIGIVSVLVLVLIIRLVARRKLKHNKVESLHRAVKTRKLSKVESLITDHVDINGLDNEYKQTALHTAAVFEFEDIMEVLVKTGHADLNGHNKNGDTPLHLAVDRSAETSVQNLILLGADINAISLKSRDTPLLRAIEKRNINIIRILTDNRADLNICDRNGDTPLHKAIDKHDPEIIAVLVGTRRADLCCRDRRGRTPLSLAITNRLDVATVTSLITDDNINIPTEHNYTPLHKAVTNNDKAVVQLLLDKGALVETVSRDEYHETPLKRAKINRNDEIINLLREHENEVLELHQAVSDGNEANVMTLINNGANLNSQDTNQRTPLHIAATNGLTTIIEILVQKGANIDAVERFGNTPLLLAVEGHSESSVRTLISLGASVNITNKDGSAPLHVALERRYTPIVKVLVDSRANLCAKDKQGLTPLCFAVSQQSDRSIIESLITQDCINSESKFGHTPLHNAVINNDSETVELLLNHGARIDTIATHYSETPLKRAVFNGNVAMVKLLLKNGATISDHKALINRAKGNKEMIKLLKDKQEEDEKTRYRRLLDRED